jgi:polysaccharide biosynthesis protein PslH
MLFLAWESPWPAHNGGDMRSLGLLRELARAYAIDLVLLSRKPLSEQQAAVLGELAVSVRRLPLRDVTVADRLAAGLGMFRGYPYHCGVLLRSVGPFPDVCRQILDFPGRVFTGNGHWGVLLRHCAAPNWVLNQCDADAEFWRVYAGQVSNPWASLAARLNYRLALRFYPAVYNSVGRVISVCEEDRQYTLALAPSAQVDVIENGVDCSYLVPHRASRPHPPRLLFTGTSAARNMTALHDFVRTVLPLVGSKLPDVELLVGGNFGVRAQAEFAGFPNTRFTGRVDDMRPVFDQSDVFVAPFQETHGSKLKVAEAMAMGMAIVSTPAGVRGFPLVDGESVLIAHSDQEFAAQVLRLLGDAEERTRLGTAARQVAEKTIDWAVLGLRLRAILSDVGGEAAAAGAPNLDEGCNRPCASG